MEQSCNKDVDKFKTIHVNQQHGLIDAEQYKHQQKHKHVPKIFGKNTQAKIQIKQKIKDKKSPIKIAQPKPKIKDKKSQIKNQNTIDVWAMFLEFLFAFVVF